MTQICVTSSMSNPCVIRGEHFNACMWGQIADEADRRAMTTGDVVLERVASGLNPPRYCRGCLPRPASRGLLCESCASKWDAALNVAAALMIHLRSIRTGNQSVDGVRVAQGSKVPIPASWQAADQIWSALSQVAIIHANNPAKEPWWPAWVTVGGDSRHRRRIDGFAPTVTLEQVAEAAQELVDWVTADAPVIVARHESAEAAVEFFRAVQTALHRFPMEDHDTPMPRLRCRQCGLFTVRQHPPLHHLAEPVLRCDTCQYENDPLLVDFNLRVYASEVWDAMTPEERAHVLPNLAGPMQADARQILRQFDRTTVEMMRARVWDAFTTRYGRQDRTPEYNQPRPVWGGLTADQMIESGRGDEVLNYLKGIA